jgi:hypothetical protein
MFGVMIVSGCANNKQYLSLQSKCAEQAAILDKTIPNNNIEKSEYSAHWNKNLNKCFYLGSISYAHDNFGFGVKS